MRLIALVRERSGVVQVREVAISHPWNSSQSCHDFCNSSLPHSAIQAHYFWHATTSFFFFKFSVLTLLFQHTFPLVLTKPICCSDPKSSPVKVWQRNGRALWFQDGPWGHAGFAAPIAENNALFFPLSSLQSKHFLLHQELKEHFLCMAMQAAKFALGSPVAQQYAEAWLELYKKAFDLYLEFSI